MSKGATVLFEDEYCHVLTNDSATFELIEGPTRFILPPNKTIYGDPKRKKYVLKDNQYCVLLHPFDKKTGQNAFGRKEVRAGPATFSLYPMEEVSGGVRNAVMLGKNETQIVKVLTDYADKKAGQLYSITGPTMFIPKTTEELVRKEEAITVSENEAIYIRNIYTAELKLVKGPISYTLGVDEEKYYKRLSSEEYKALGIPEEASYKAFVVQIQKNECICITDYKNNKESYITGPESKILGAYEGVKVLNISAGVPKQENAAKIAQVNLGPDFMNDQFNVRTKDNAVLEVELTYKWRFLVDDDSVYKLFESDFIGYSCQSLRSRIREEASSHEFEKFHTAASQILREKLFKDYTMNFTREGKKTTESFRGRFFKEFNFLIFELDVKRVSPVDKEIESLLDESIKASMKILCRKLNDNAETEAEKEKIDSEAEIAKLNRNLIQIQNANYSKEVLEKARIEGAALVEEARASAAAESLIERSRMQQEIDNMKAQMELLKGPSGDKYIEYVKAMALADGNISNVTVLPSEIKSLFVPASLQDN